MNSKPAGHERIDALFVQSATGFTSNGGGTITLRGLAESTVYFADRPRREVGHMRSSSFIELWDAGADSFAVDPPNAVLSFLDGDDTPDDVVVVLHDPRLDGNDLTYTVDVLEGTLPESTGPARSSSTPSDVRGRRSRFQRAQRTTPGPEPAIASQPAVS